MVKASLHGFFTALTFLTIIPAPGNRKDEPPDFVNAVKFFPVIGLVIGSILLAAEMLTRLLLPQPVSWVFLVLLFSLISGFLHLDGLADTADGIMSSRPRKVILEIMKDSRIGVMGAGCVVFVLLFKVAAISAISADNLTLALLFAPYYGRVAIVAMMGCLTYARAGQDGLAGVFVTTGALRLALGQMILFAMLWIVTTGLHGVLCLLVSATIVGAFLVLCYRKIGGYTGDTLGASCELGETVFLIGAATFL